MNTSQLPRTPLLVRGDVLTIGDSQRSASVGEADSNDALFSAYIDFLCDLRAVRPTVGSLRSGDVEVLALVTGLTAEEVRHHLEQLVGVQSKRLSRRTRKGLFAAAGVCILGGALVLASTVARPAASPTAAAREVNIGSALTIDRVALSPARVAAKIDSALSLERSDVDLPPNVEIQSALTIER
jgi:hypothetical protein